MKSEGASARWFAPVEEQIESLRKGVVDLVTEAELEKKLVASRQAGRPLRVKVGFDPSAPDIHLGHTVLLRKMKQFQDLGHQVVFLIGDFTSLIGDPTGRSKTRPQLTPEEIRRNAETYKEQAFKILDPARTVTRFNSEWLGRLGSEGFIRLAARYNVARMLERRDFKKRYGAGESIRIHEFLYPLAQAFDSVTLKTDVELGGTDQLFNLNVGRDIMPEYGLPPQVVMTTPLLEGIDGTEKMSKSLGNYIGVTEPPGEIFGKIMSVSDELMWRYYLLCTDLTVQEIESRKRRVKNGQLHPRDAKVDLAKIIITDFHSATAAAEAAEEFQRVFSRGQVPAQVAERVVAVHERGRYLLDPASNQTPDQSTLLLPVLLADAGLARSRSAARRLVEQGAVKIDGETARSEQFVVGGAKLREGVLVKVGKRHYRRFRFES
ncbi:MAG: tyrosine--tRNA ligase [Acidobacteriota bacterium]